MTGTEEEIKYKSVEGSETHRPHREELYEEEEVSGMEYQPGVEVADIFHNIDS